MFPPKPIKTEHEETNLTTQPRPFLNPLIKVKKEETEQEQQQDQNQETKHQTPETNQHESEEKPSNHHPTNQHQNEEKQRRKGKSTNESSSRNHEIQSRRLTKGSSVRPITAENREKLSQILNELAMNHEWKEASGVLSVLLAGTPTGTNLRDDRRNFLVGAEILRRFGDKSRFDVQMKKWFEVWMAKLNYLKKSDDKKPMVMMELALFYISQGSIQEAYDITNLLIQDKRGTKNTPILMLLHGLISYQLWYTTNIPEEMQIKNFEDISNNCKETESVLESTNDHNALDIEDPGFVSDSSVCNSNNNNENPRKKMKTFGKRNAGFYVNDSIMNSERENNCSASNLANLENTSIFLAHGLDPILLPIRLKLMHEDLRVSIESYRNFVNEMYNCAVQNLRGSLHSNPPQIAALLPLIQLLLLGDRVKDAADELEKSCHVLNNSAEPFRLRAKLLESFAKNQTNIISSCCEEVLKRDSTCSYSIRTLIRLHKKGDYSTNNLLEMLANHIETVDDCGPNIWEELAICFLNLVNASNTCNYEDNVSINTKRGLDSIFSSSKKIPELFCDGKILGTWKIRHRWWLNIHFSGKNILSESQSGDYRLLTCKAACACHIYRPEFDYVIKVHEMLQKQGMNDEILFLRVHMKNPLSEFLNLGS